MRDSIPDRSTRPAYGHPPGPVPRPESPSRVAAHRLPPQSGSKER